MAQHTQPVAQQPNIDEQAQLLQSNNVNNVDNVNSVNNNSNDNNNTNSTSSNNCNNNPSIAYSNSNNNNSAPLLTLVPVSHQLRHNNNALLCTPPAYSAGGGGAPMQTLANGPPTTVTGVYNPPVHSPNLYMPAVTAHQPTTITYPTIVPAHIPNNVYMNNVTANASMHGGWAHNPYVAGATSHYIHSEMSPDQGTPVMQPMAGHNLVTMLPSPHSSTPMISGRGARRGRGRGVNAGMRRNEYVTHRHLPPAVSPTDNHVGGPLLVQQDPMQHPQQHVIMQHLSQQQLPSLQQQPLETQLMAPHPQYSQAPQPSPYQYATYPTYYAPQNIIHHHQGQSVAQQATGTQLYMPMYNAQQVYNCMGTIIYRPLVNAGEYQYVAGDEMVQCDDRPHADSMMQPIHWHPHPMYNDEYAMSPEMHGGPTSVDEMTLSDPGTPGMLSPNYAIYDPHLQEMHQQMAGMHMYDDPQTMGGDGSMNQGAPGAQLHNPYDEELSHVMAGGDHSNSSPSGTIQLLPSGALALSAIPSDTSIITQHHIQPPPVIQPGLVGIDPPIPISHPTRMTIEQLNMAMNRSPNIVRQDPVHSMTPPSSLYDYVPAAHLSQMVIATDQPSANTTATSRSASNIADDGQQQHHHHQRHQHQQHQEQQQQQQQHCNDQKVSNDSGYNNYAMIATSTQTTGAMLHSQQQQTSPKEDGVQLLLPPRTFSTTHRHNYHQNQDHHQHQDHHPDHHQHQDHHHDHHASNHSQHESGARKQQPTPYVTEQLHSKKYAHELSGNKSRSNSSCGSNICTPHTPNPNNGGANSHANANTFETVSRSNSWTSSGSAPLSGDLLLSPRATTKALSWTNSTTQMKKQTVNVSVTATPSSLSIASAYLSNSNSASDSYLGASISSSSSNSHSHNSTANAGNSGTSNPNSNGNSNITTTGSSNKQTTRIYGSGQHVSPNATTAIAMSAANRTNSPPIINTTTVPAPPALSERRDSRSGQAMVAASPALFIAGANIGSSGLSTTSATSGAGNNPVGAVAAVAATPSTIFTSAAASNMAAPNKQYPGFANKKSIASASTAAVQSAALVAAAGAATFLTPTPAVAAAAAANSSSATAAPIKAASTPVESPASAMNLAPPQVVVSPYVANAAPAAVEAKSWASLFMKGSSNTSSSTCTNSGTATTTASSNTSNFTANGGAALPTPFAAKRPSPKAERPPDGLSLAPPQTAAPAVTPGVMSYSAASAQGLVTATAVASSATVPAKKSNEAATTVLSSLSVVQHYRNSGPHIEEQTHRFGNYLNAYKTDLSLNSLRPRGLTNRSNYCYINSILQALLGCSPFYNMIRSIPKYAVNLAEMKTPTVNAMYGFMSHFSTLPNGLRLRTNNKGPKSKDDVGADLQSDPAFEPTEIYKLWNDSREEQNEGRQEDAEEFLGYVLNKLNDEMLEVIKAISKVNQNGQSESEQQEGNESDGDSWQMICNNRNKGSVTRQSDFGRTPLSDIFRGELRSRLQREGEQPTDVIQPFFTLQLNIEKAASVKEALEILVGRDQLEGVTGSKSKQEVVAWQQMTLEKLPFVLILHLKWFDYRSDGCTKILKKVDFPVDLKIDSKILASKKYSQKQRAYRLFAVVYHDGKEASKGHYITDVFHNGYNSWLRYDDSSVKPVSENHVLLPRTPRVPYLLYYRRCDTMPMATLTTVNGCAAFNTSIQSTANAAAAATTTSGQSGRERDGK